ncbi:MAG: phenylalanine--tRNA ligase subunit beta [Candidatus Gastranaerophilales bacterium]|nr:phenylalanine--tRNA ligase subunit beta [Candidatus Gastranaerophilales bacterium]
MQISLEWLSEFVDIKGLTPQEIAHGLTMSGLEVEAIETLGAEFTDVKTAKILEVNAHPNADKLHLVKVDTGSVIKTVVCGAQNIEAGQIIPYASVGSKVLDRKTGEQYALTPAVIRGVESQGMLCSQDELGLDEFKLQEEDGILILNRIYPDLGLGKDLREVLNIVEDVIIHVAPTANRGDEMSVIGIAREIAAVFDRDFKFSKLTSVSEIKSPDFEVDILDESVCKYYAIGVLKKLKVQKSPQWMQRRLNACGVRSISNVVDITNYVMLEYGQPLHAFDLDKLNGYLCVRRANEGEKFVTLDDVERRLTNDSVLIAAKEKAVALAGVMGGANSEIDDNTVNIALESAYFNPATTRKSSKSVGLRSEANARFERGIDIESVKSALYRAVQLLIELAGGEFDGICEAGDDKLEEQVITLRFAQIKRYLGIDIPQEECVRILEKLGFALNGQNQMAARFIVPSFRAVDVTREIDLIEEVARIYGYDKVTPTLPNKTFSSEKNFDDTLIGKLHQLLLGKGLSEAITSSLVGQPLYKFAGVDYIDEKAVKVLNPQSEDHTMLRQSVVPNLLSVLKNNIDNGNKNVWLYEFGKTFSIEEPSDTKNPGVKEKRMLCAVISGNIDKNCWLEGQNIDFYFIKGLVEDIFELLKLDNRIVYEAQDGASYFHPKRSANAVLLGKNKSPAAVFGQLHPLIQDKLKLNQEAYLIEIDLDLLLENAPKSTVIYKELPIFPAVVRDIAFVIPKDITAQDIAKNIKKSINPALFKSVDIFDIYQGDKMQEGFKSVAYHICLQDKNATLTDEIVDAEIKKLKDSLKKVYPEAAFRE